jgi:hypothetical protein
MRHFIAAFVLLLLAPGCKSGGGSEVPATIPAPAAAMDTKLKASMVRVLPMVASIESSLVFVLNPGTPMAQGVTVQPDPTSGAPPHSITFSGPYDGNGDGYNETTMSGRAAFVGDPDVSWSGLDGQVGVDVDIPIVGHVYHANLAFAVTTNERRLSGSGTFTDPLSGDATTMTVATPLVVKPATGAAGAVSNACGYSLDGQMRLDVAGSTGTLKSTWNFSSSNPSVAVNGASFTDASGQTTALPASTVDLRCGSSGSINDWVATYDQNYACLPRESGQATITITVAGPNSITIGDQDPPGSGDVKTYAATIVSANPHAVRGFFNGGPPGNRYREDFTWTLGKNGGFSQVSSYTYFEGPNAGSSGLCVASARKR